MKFKFGVRFTVKLDTPHKGPLSNFLVLPTSTPTHPKAIAPIPPSIPSLGLACAHCEYFFASCYAMELPFVPCGTSPTQHIIVTADGIIWVSSRSMSAALGYTKARGLEKLFREHPHFICDRSVFPAPTLLLAREKVPHRFILLSCIRDFVVTAKRESVCTLETCIHEYVAKESVTQRALAQQLSSNPSNRHSNVAGSTNVAQIRVRPRASVVIADVRVPPPDFIDPGPKSSTSQSLTSVSATSLSTVSQRSRSSSFGLLFSATPIDVTPTTPGSSFFGRLPATSTTSAPLFDHQRSL
jgi:hypothetical protein